MTEGCERRAWEASRRLGALLWWSLWAAALVLAAQGAGIIP